jgi:menaquinone-specific isochorismate synthase
MKRIEHESGAEAGPCESAFPFPTQPEELLELFHEASPHLWHSPTHTFVRYTIALGDAPPAGELLQILAFFQEPEKTYWQNRSLTLEAAGIGAAFTIEGNAASLPTILRLVQDSTLGAPDNARFYGGARFFPDDAPDALWSEMGETRFTLPFLLYEREGENRNARLRVHCSVAMQRAPERSEEETLDLARRLLRERLACLRCAASAVNTGENIAENDAENSLNDNAWSSSAGNGSFPRALRRENTPNEAQWRANIGSALRLFHEETLEKVVLARRVTLHLSAKPDVAALLQRRMKTAQSATAFAFQYRQGGAFFGATPEYLYRREGRTIVTEAVAGTRPRGATPNDDARLSEELLQSDKDRREHAAVQRYIASSLDELAESFTIGAVELLKLSQVQHLYAPFSGRLRSTADDAAIIARLHPTPAVGGNPRGAALEFLRASEGFDRGWYAAPVGWLSARAAEFVVAIRSALLVDDRIYIFSGAGIVAGSEADKEWNEMEIKIAPLLEMFSA